MRNVLASKLFKIDLHTNKKPVGLTFSHRKCNVHNISFRKIKTFSLSYRLYNWLNHLIDSKLKIWNKMAAQGDQCIDKKMAEKNQSHRFRNPKANVLRKLKRVCSTRLKPYLYRLFVVLPCKHTKLYIAMLFVIVTSFCGANVPIWTVLNCWQL